MLLALRSVKSNNVDFPYYLIKYFNAISNPIFTIIKYLILHFITNLFKD